MRKKLKQQEELLKLLERNVKFCPKTAARLLYKGVNTPLSQKLLHHLETDDLRSIVSMKCDPANYQDAESYFLDKIAVDFLRKYPFRGMEDEAQLAAEHTFLDCERICGATNDFFRTWLAGRCDVVPAVASILYDARWKIAKVLGKLDVEEWISSCRFGPGVALGSKSTSDFDKLSDDPGTTEEFERYVLCFLSEFSGWVNAWTYNGEIPVVQYKVYPGGKFATVPKEALKNRCIETQPSVNGFAQLGLGSCIRRRLSACGIDLNDQSRNAELARSASISGDLATLDLTNASDLNATELCRYLLPPDWFHAMDICRTHRILYKDKVVELQRFSSMGNGFTFELESLIFWALSLCATRYEADYRLKTKDIVSVYGDDIIVPVYAYERTVQVLRVCGFIPNTRKSFNTGPFRESCGSDWWNGRNVRPYLLKKEIKNVPALITLANGVTRAARRLSGHYGTDRRLAPVILYCLRRIPAYLRRRIGFGETETDQYILHRRVRHGYAVAFDSTRIPIQHWYPALATALYRGTRVQRTYTDEVWDNPITRLSRAVDYYATTSVSSSNGLITNYKRDFGRWSLKLQPSWFLSEPEVWRGWC